MGATGYDFLRVEEDNWDDLTYEEQQAKIEEEKKKIFASLSEIEKSEYKSQSDVASYIRGESFLKGEDTYSNLDNKQVIDLAGALGHPMAGEVFEPSGADILQVKANQIYNQFANDMPAYMQLGLRGKKGADDYSFKEKQQLRMSLKMDNPNIGREELDVLTFQAMENGAILESNVLRNLQESRDNIDKAIKDNPKARATMEWMSTELKHPFRSGEVGKWVEQLLLDVGPSILWTQGSGLAGGIVGGWTGTWGGPYGIVAGAIGGKMIASGTAGLVMEGGAYLKEEWEKRTQDREIDEKTFLENMALVDKTYNEKYPDGNFLDKGLNKITNRTELKQLYLKNNYEIIDGRYIRKGLSDEEALEAVAGGSHMYGTVSFFTEQISMAKYLPGASSAKKILPKWVKNNSITKFIDKIEDNSRLIPKTTVMNRTKRWMGENGFRVFVQNTAEGIEEVAQGMEQAVISVYGPGALDDLHYYNTRPRDEHGGWTQIRDEFAGGVLGSAPVHVATAGKAITGLDTRLINRDILKKTKTQKGIRYGVKGGVNEKGKKVYDVAGYNTVKAGGKSFNVKKLDMSKLKGKDGEQLQTRFDNFQDAFNVADTYNKQQAANLNTLTAWRYKDIRRGAVKTVENEDGTFSAEIYDNDGNLFQKDEKTFNKKYKANRRKKELENTIENISHNYNKYKLDDAENNEVVKNYERVKDIISNVKKPDTNKELSKGDVGDVEMGIAAFMVENLNLSDVASQEKYNEMLERVFDNPDEIINLVNRDTNNQSLKARGHTPERILTAFDETFGPDGENITDFKKKRKELNDALYPQGPPKNQNKGPDVEEGPGLTIPEPPVGAEGPIVEEGPDISPQQDLFEEPTVQEGPSKKKTPKKRVAALSKTPSEQIETNIGQLKEEIPTLKEGTNERKLAEKRLSMLEKEVERRKQEEKKAPVKKKLVLMGVPSRRIEGPVDIEGVNKVLDDVLPHLSKSEPKLIHPEARKIGFLRYIVNKMKESPEGTHFSIAEILDMLIPNSGRDNANPKAKKLRHKLNNQIIRRLSSLEASDILEYTASDTHRNTWKLGERFPIKGKLQLEVTKEAIEELSPELKKINEVTDVVERLIGTFDNKINVDLQNLGPRVPVGKYDPNTNTVIINLDNPDLDIDAPFHEFSHPFISMIAKDNPELFNSIYEEAIKADEGLLERIKFTYRKEIAEGELDEQGVKEEVIAHSIDRLSKKTYQQLEALSEKNPLRKLWTAIKRFFNYIMDKYGIKKFDNAYNLLTPSTTLQELSDIIINYDNKYIVDMGSKAFQDEAIDIATNEGDIAGVEVVDSITEAAIVSEENAFIDHMTGNLKSVKEQKDLDRIINKIIKISEKRFPVRTKKYKGTAIQRSINYKLGIEGDTLPTSRDRFVAKLKSEFIKLLPPTIDLNKKHIEKLININEAVSGEIKFRYRFVENDKLKDPNGISNIKDLHTWPGIRKGEKENIKEFAKTIKVNSMKNIDIINAYIGYTNKKLGLSYVISKNYSQALGYEKFFPELEGPIYEPEDEPDLPSIEGDRPEVHRVLIVRNKTYPMAAHGFPELKTPKQKSTFQRKGGGPLGWYTVAYAKGRILLHEFQSDVLMETLEVIRRVNLNKGKVTLDAKKPIPNLLNLLLSNTVESDAVNYTLNKEREYIDDPISNMFRLKNVKVQVGFKDSLFEGIPYNFKGGDYTFETNLDYKNNVGRIISTFVARLKIDIADSKNKIELEHVKLIIDRLINLENYIEYSKPKIDNFGTIDVFTSELEHKLSNLKSTKYNMFQQLKIEKYMNELISGYGEKGHTNQERADLKEVFQFYADTEVDIEYGLHLIRVDMFTNEDLFINFPNKDNSFYRFLLSLDNEQRTPEYSKKPFKYKGTAIREALLSFADLLNSKQLDVPQIINKDGSISSYFKDNAGYGKKLPGVFFAAYRDSSQRLHEYIKDYVRSRDKIENYTDMRKLGIEATPVFLDEVLRRYKYYTREYMRKLGTIALVSEFANSSYDSTMDEIRGKEEVIDLGHVVNNITELKNAKEELSVTSKWFQNLIMHSILHSHVTKPGKDIYINTASAISLIENTSAPFNVYANKKEHQWRNLHHIVHSSPHESETDFREIFFNEVEGWYQKNKKDFKNPNAIDSAIKTLKVTGWRNSLYGYSNSYLSENVTKDISEAQDIILDFIINESKNNIFWNYNISHKLTQKNYGGTVKWGDKSVLLPSYNRITGTGDINLTRLRSLEIVERNKQVEAINRMLKETIEKEFSHESQAIRNYLYNQHAVFDRPIIEGIFRKALWEVKDDKMNGIEVELVHPKWSATPLYKVKIINDKKLVPVKWKKKLKIIQNSKDVPQSVKSLEINLKNKIELENLNARTEEYRIIKGFFDSAWRNMQMISGKKKVDIQDFKQVMNHVIDEQLVPAFEQWWETKFEEQMDKADRVRDIGKDKYVWMQKDDLSIELVPNYNDWAENESVKQMLDRGITNEKILNLNDIVYFKTLKMSITELQLNTLYTSKHRFKDYESWKPYVKSYLNIAFKLTRNQDEELHKFWNRIKYSTVRTNRDGDGSSNQRDSFVVKVTTKFVRGIGWTLEGINVKKKGVENAVTGNRNNKYEKITLFENSQTMGLFSFISGGDVLGNYAEKDNDGNYIYEREGPKKKIKENFRKKYGFFNIEELNRLESYLRTMGYTIAFSRGDSDKIGLVRITDDHKEKGKLADAKKYWKQEFDSIANTPEERQNLENILPDYLSGDTMDRAASIAIHEALKQVFPNYLLDPKGGANVYKRLKIPFTPVTISKEMPPIRVDKFDPHKVKFVTRENPEGYNAIQDVPGLGATYIGDGNSLSSQLLFDLFFEHHGLAKTTAKAKTVIYQNDGTNALAIKHQHVLPKRHLEVVDKSTGEVLYKVDNNRNITDKDGNPVHMLVTDDEVKIGDMFRDTNSIQVNGESIGFTKYDEVSKSTVKHIMQWYNYVQDPAVLSQFMKVYGPILGKGVTDALTMGIEGEDLNSAEGIKKFLRRFSGREHTGFALTAVELAELGAGVHPSLEHVLDVLIQTQALDPALNMNKSPGSIYDVSMDVTGTIGEGEIALAIQNSTAVMKHIAGVIGKPVSDLTIAETNRWLEKNEVHVMVTRSPVAYAGGAYMARVKYLHSRRSLADLNIIDLRLKLEGDGDGDEVHVELLDSETTEIYRNYMKTIKTKPLNLNNFVSKKVRKISTRIDRQETMSSLIAGQTAIAEIANVTAIYGMLYKTFNDFTIMGQTLKLRKPTDKIEFPEAFYNGKQGAWKGTVEEYLRIWLQAAVDNNEFGLLYDWDYSQDKLILSLFENAGPDTMNFIKPIIEYYKEVLSIRRGYNFKKNFKLTDTIEISKNIYQQALDRGAFDVVENDIVMFKANVKNPQLTPYELVAIAPYRIWQQTAKKYNMFGFNGTPYKISTRVHRNAHKYARDYLEATLDDIWIDAKNIDLDSGKWDGTNEKQYLQSEVTVGRQYIVGSRNEPGIGVSLYQMLKKLKQIGPQTIDRNDEFIEWKDDWNGVFANLSQVAKVAATISFLRGYLTLNQKLELTKGTQHPKIFPSVSKKKTETSLLDAGIVEKFFEKYHEYINKRDPQSLNKLIEHSSEHRSLIQSVMRICGG